VDASRTSQSILRKFFSAILKYSLPLKLTFGMQLLYTFPYFYVGFRYAQYEDWEGNAKQNDVLCAVEGEAATVLLLALDMRSMRTGRGMQGRVMYCQLWKEKLQHCCCRSSGEHCPECLFCSVTKIVLVYFLSRRVMSSKLYVVRNPVYS
jgi:hypothetical protein